MVKYTVRNQCGEVVAAHISVEMAAHEILAYDSASYYIEKDQESNGWALHAKSLHGSYDIIETSRLENEEEATLEMTQHIVDRASTCEGWNAEAVPDEIHEKMLDELISNSDEDEIESLKQEKQEWIDA